MQRAEQIGPEAHQTALLLQFKAVALQGCSAAMAAPQGLVMIPGMGAEGDAFAQSARGGLAFAAAQTGEHKQAAGLDSGDAVEAPQLGEAQPLIGWSGPGSRSLRPDGMGTAWRRGGPGTAGGAGGLGPGSWTGHGRASQCTHAGRITAPVNPSRAKRDMPLPTS